MVNFELLEKKMDERDISRAEMISKLGIDDRGEQGGEQTHLCPILICANQREEIDGQKD